MSEKAGERERGVIIKDRERGVRQRDRQITQVVIVDEEERKRSNVV